MEGDPGLLFVERAERGVPLGLCGGYEKSGQKSEELDDGREEDHDPSQRISENGGRPKGVVGGEGLRIDLGEDEKEERRGDGPVEGGPLRAFPLVIFEGIGVDGDESRLRRGKKGAQNEAQDKQQYSRQEHGRPFRRRYGTWRS